MWCIDTQAGETPRHKKSCSKSTQGGGGIKICFDLVPEFSVPWFLLGTCVKEAEYHWQKA